MTTWLGWRLLKFLGLALWAGGLATAWSARDRVVRYRAWCRLAGPGTLAVWIAGYALMKATGRSFEPWIVVPLLTGAVAHGATGRVVLDDGATPVWRGIAGAAAVASVVSMVLRPVDAIGWGVWAVVSALAGVAVGGLGRSDGVVGELGAQRVWEGFRVLARLEGLSLIALMGIAMPLKRLTGIVLDGGTGLLGWTHGALFILYVATLPSVARAMDWTWGRTGGAFLASLLPFGTFVFERRVERGLGG